MFAQFMNRIRGLLPMRYRIVVGGTRLEEHHKIGVAGEAATRRAFRKFPVSHLKAVTEKTDYYLPWVRELAAAELRQREAWHGPAAVSARTAQLALIVSILSLALGVFNAVD